MGRLKIYCLIDHDIMIRHFLLSGALSDLRKQHDVTFIFPEPRSTRVTYDLDALGLESYMRLSPLTKRVAAWKEIFLANQLKWRPGKAYRGQRRAYAATLSDKDAKFYARRSWPGVFTIFKRNRLKVLDRLPNPVAELILKDRPDVILHPSVLDGPYIHDLMNVSKESKIPLIVIMNSWDNPGLKQTLVGTPDWLLVWGEQTKEHAVRYMKMDPNRAIPFGAAQFEVYKSPSRIGREEFCRRNGVSPGKTLLMYAGSSKRASELLHLEMLEQAVEAGHLKNTVILYRPHPWGQGGRDGHLILEREWRHVVIESTMREYLERVSRGDKSMFLSDYRDTRDVLNNIDALISPLSTIILEAALNGKPSLCLLPNCGSPKDFLSWARGMVHFQEMFACPEFLVANGEAELIDKSLELILRAGDPSMRQRVLDAADFFVARHEGSYAARLTDFLQLVGSGKI